MKEVLYCCGSSKCYVVKRTKTGEKFIIKNKQKVFLSTMRGKYRYVQSGHGNNFLAESQTVLMDKEGTKEYVNIKKVVNDMKVPFFRKTFYEGSFHEHDIASLIYQKQKQGSCIKLVRILEVNKDFYDAELLDVYYHDKSTLVRDIQQCLEELHKLHIIYIDLKDDNIGYSHIDKRWKIFDFDSSGIANRRYTQWVKEPPFYYAYKTAYKKFFDIPDNVDTLQIQKDKGEVLPLTKLDEFMFNSWKQHVGM